MREAILIPLGYLLGGMPWGYWIPLVFARVDIRKRGSGNVGATNVWRTLGFKYGLSVALLDILKGLTAGLLGTYLGDPTIGVLAGTAALVGHWRPLFLGFEKGGKIVAVTGGVGLAVAPIASLAAVLVWILIFLLTRYASLASLVAGVALPVFAFAMGASWAVMAFTMGAGLAIVVLHRANVMRLIRGEESRFDFSGLSRRRSSAPQA
jgi:glycerol-3-phosphate acyltransferase PlsY